MLANLETYNRSIQFPCSALALSWNGGKLECACSWHEKRDNLWVGTHFDYHKRAVFPDTIVGSHHQEPLNYISSQDALTMLLWKKMQWFVPFYHPTKLNLMPCWMNNLYNISLKNYAINHTSRWLPMEFLMELKQRQCKPTNKYFD